MKEDKRIKELEAEVESLKYIISKLEETHIKGD